MSCIYEHWKMVLVPPDDCDHECFCSITGETCTASYIGKDGKCDVEAVKIAYAKRIREEEE